LFNEGYYSRSANGILRKEFCIEAIRLGIMLTEYPLTDVPKTNALMALMCFHASRFDARQNSDDIIVLYDEQDDSMWNRELIDRGIVYLSKSATGPEISSYHLEARIAYWHCIKEDTQKKWEEILSLYDQLLQLNYSPTVALNRLFAIYKVQGADVALNEAAKLEIEHTHFYFVLLAELYKSKDTNKALASLEQALELAKTETERQLVKKKIEELRYN
jgi:RNA polymerase sigma-70 factor (ECF subfamily)